RSHFQFVSVQDEGFVQRGDESLPGQLGGETSVQQYENGEFVASQTGNGVRLVEYVPKTRADVPQQTISIMVPKGIVDVFEAIHPQHEHGEPARRREALLQLIVEQRPIR